MSINVEVIGGTLMVQHYVELMAEEHHLVLDSVSDLFTPAGRVQLPRATLLRSLEQAMSASEYGRETTALLFVDPYNDFLSEGGLVWPRLKEVAGEVGLLENLRAIHAAAGPRAFVSSSFRIAPGKGRLDVDLRCRRRVVGAVHGLPGAQQRLGRDARPIGALAADQLVLDGERRMPASWAEILAAALNCY